MSKEVLIKYSQSNLSAALDFLVANGINPNIIIAIIVTSAVLFGLMKLKKHLWNSQSTISNIAKNDADITDSQIKTLRETMESFSKELHTAFEDNQQLATQNRLLVTQNSNLISQNERLLIRIELAEKRIDAWEDFWYKNIDDDGNLDTTTIKIPCAPSKIRIKTNFNPMATSYGDS